MCGFSIVNTSILPFPMKQLILYLNILVTLFIVAQCLSFNSKLMYFLGSEQPYSSIQKAVFPGFKSLLKIYNNLGIFNTVCVQI